MKRWDEIVRRMPDYPITFAEVGVYLGQNVIHIHKHKPDTFFYLIDRYQFYPEWAKSGSTMAQFDQTIQDHIKKSAAKDIEETGLVHEWIYKDSREAWKDIQEDLDFVFLDGNHAYECVLEEILTYRKLVRAGGWIGGHDFRNPGQGNVEKAVLEVFGDNFETGEDHTWFVQL